CMLCKFGTEMNIKIPVVTILSLIGHILSQLKTSVHSSHFMKERIFIDIFVVVNSIATIVAIKCFVGQSFNYYHDNANYLENECAHTNYCYKFLSDDNRERRTLMQKVCGDTYGCEANSCLTYTVGTTRMGYKTPIVRIWQCCCEGDLCNVAERHTAIKSIFIYILCLVFIIFNPLNFSYSDLQVMILMKNVYKD
uniref:UPAR/Ly6 domain-containing protein n=2 Tax=Parascaris univalens TaxID=6257 RepID=A0A914ZQ08_PARUN